MTLPIISFMIYALIAVLLYFSVIKDDIKKGVPVSRNKSNLIWVSLATYLFVKIVASIFYRGFEIDMNCFASWSDSAFKNGFAKFYTSGGFVDYPPGYLYVLYFVGSLRSLFHSSGALDVILIKLPAIICDIITGYLIYKEASKRYAENVSQIIVFLYVLNPLVILDSSIWGQVDSVFLLFVLLCIILINEKKLYKAYFIFMIGILMKPQTAFFAPIIIFATIDHIFLPQFNKDKLLKTLAFGLGSILFFFALCVPFGVSQTINQYIKTLSSYNYVTVNAYNVYALFGLDWASNDTKFLFMNFGQLGTIMIVLAVAISVYLYIKNIDKEDKSKYFYISAFIVTFMFMLSTKMHERYLFPLIALLAFVFIYKPYPKFALLYIGFSFVEFLNVAHILKFYDPKNFNRTSPEVIMISLLAVVMFAFLIYLTYIYYVKQKEEIIIVQGKKIVYNKQVTYNQRVANAEKNKNSSFNPLCFVVEYCKMKKLDYLALAVIITVYSCITMYNLGGKVDPVTEWHPQKNQSAIIDMGKSTNIATLRMFHALPENPKIMVSYSDDKDGTFKDKGEFDLSSVFSWQDDNVNIIARYLKITSSNDSLRLNEVGILDANKQTIKPISSTIAEIIDEQNTVPSRISYRNSTYFDEIYHARTAYEHLNGVYPYETTHPPLGKVIMSFGIFIFGMNPFGWRVMGAFFGILMVPVIYIFAKRMLKHTWLSIAVCLLFTFDFMHFAQTRIATIDVYVTFFIMLMYYFMYKFWTMDLDKVSTKSIFVTLGLCGLSMGLGVASKWSGVYAAVGLAILFFIKILHSSFAKSLTNKDLDKYISLIKKLAIWCLVVFAIIPAVIYALSYIPTIRATNTPWLKVILDSQKGMFDYHSHLKATHPFSSWWYQWPIMLRPIWYYSGEGLNGLKESISAFGNPAVWWAGIYAVACTLYLAIAKKDKTALFLLIAYFAQLVPWMPVSLGRITFIYHYFPCVPFIALMIGYVILNMYNAVTENKPEKANVVVLGFIIDVPKSLTFVVAVYAYVAIAIILFAMFYPVLSGAPVDRNYVLHYLKWFKSWVLVG